MYIHREIIIRVGSVLKYCKRISIGRYELQHITPQGIGGVATRFHAGIISGFGCETGKIGLGFQCYGQTYCQ